MRVLAAAIGGMLLGALCGWLLGWLFASLVPDEEGMGALVLPPFCALLGGTVGLIVGGGLAARRLRDPPQGEEST